MTEYNIFRGVNSIKFNQRFKDDKDCLEYLADVKWLNDYKCKRCFINTNTTQLIKKCRKKGQ
jgi:hypothetical protein